MKQRFASLSLDLDNKWSYLKTHGDASWKAYPTYLPLVVPRVLALLRELDLTITFFIVGRDAADPANAQVLRAIADAGHEIGNHSFDHEPWLHRYSPERVAQEIASAEAAIASATGARTQGFRGPGYSISEATLAVLAARGYLYDASTLPTFIGPLARAYYFMTSRLTAEERQEREALFGSVRDALLPLTGYSWATENGPIVEIPVTTMPLVRAPIHVSYQLYLAHYSRLLARTYFAFALRLCDLGGVPPSLLLHPLDFMGGDDDADLAFFPGMGMSAATKTGLVREMLVTYRERFEVVTMREHAVRLRKSASLPTRTPHLRTQSA